MEMALQPCGFLSAYLRSPMLLPEADLYFRNLGGHARILEEMDLRGRTVSNHVRLTSSTRAQGVILQAFTFVMSCEGQPFYEGDASFGFFPREAMLRQAGVSSSEATMDAARTEGALGDAAPAGLPGGVSLAEPAPYQLRLLHRIAADPTGGRYGQGMRVGQGRVTPCDLVLPRAFLRGPRRCQGRWVWRLAARALRAFGRWRGADLVSPAAAVLVAAPAAGAAQAWKYRGQITPPRGGRPPGGGGRDHGAWSLGVHRPDSEGTWTRMGCAPA